MGNRNQSPGFPRLTGSPSRIFLGLAPGEVRESPFNQRFPWNSAICPSVLLGCPVLGPSLVLVFHINDIGPLSSHFLIPPTHYSNLHCLLKRSLFVATPSLRMQSKFLAAFFFACSTLLGQSRQLFLILTSFSQCPSLSRRRRLL